MTEYARLVPGRGWDSELGPFENEAEWKAKAEAWHAEHAGRNKGARVRIPILHGPMHTVTFGDLPPLDASDPRFGTGLGYAEIDVSHD